MSKNASVIEIEKLINSRNLGPLQVTVMVICGLTVLLDGFDTQSVAFVVPSIAAAWHLPHAALGPIFVASLVGLLFGTLIFGTVADKLGRRSVILMSTLLFSTFTLLTAGSDSVTELLVFRFFTGIGLGGVLPNVIALTAEYSPERRRATMITLMFVGFPLGAAAGGLLASIVIPQFGWRVVWYIGGALPLLLLPLQFFALPESLRTLILNEAPRERIVKLVRRLAPDMQFAEDARFSLAEIRAPGVPVSYLFLDRRTLGTILLWIIFFSNLLDLYFVQDWLPILVHAAGLTIRQAVLIGTLFQVGGIIAAPLVGLFMDRFGSYKVLLSLYGAGALLVVATGQIGTDAATLMAMSFCIGICIVGGQIATFTHTARFYPTAMRSTGIGWSMGIGRIGGIVGPLIAGVLISLQWGHALLFFVGGLPLAFATLAIFVMAKAYQGAASRNAGGETSLAGTAAAAKQPQA